MQQAKIVAIIYLILLSNVETKKHQHFRVLQGQEKNKLFFVNTSTCQMPFVQPFNAQVRSFWKPRNFEKCKSDEDAVTTSFDEKLGQYVLHINKAVLDDKIRQLEWETREYNLSYACSYEKISRSGKGKKADKSYRLSAMVPFVDGQYVPLDVEFIITKCRSNKQHMLQKDAFSFVQLQQAQSTPTATAEQAPRRANVIMLGIDSLSRINFRRNMPRMLKLFQQEGWLELQGYNKIADNTYPNLMAVLTGYIPKTVDETICNTNEVGCIESLPFVWQHYKRAGYKTAYAEDLTSLNTFIYLKNGFVHQPVDYYLRPFLLGIEECLPIRKRFSRAYCIGRRLNAGYIYNYCQQLLQRYEKISTPLLGLFWTSSFTHDAMDGAHAMDNRLLQYMQNFKKHAAYNKSIVIFFSDHGQRYGRLRQLPTGLMEESLPTMFIWLPHWFRQQYPQIVEALNINAHRLTTPFDLHLTLHHILQLGEKQPQPLPKLRDCPNCQSLFEPMPENRNCSDAGIPVEYCNCKPYETLKNQVAQKLPIGKLLVQHINEFIYMQNWQKLCSNLTLNEILSVDERRTLKKQDLNYYHIKFTAKPSEAMFMSTVSYNRKLKRLESANIELISRLDSYDDDAQCMNDKIGKKVCICLDHVERLKAEKEARKQAAREKAELRKKLTITIL